MGKRIIKTPHHHPGIMFKTPHWHNMIFIKVSFKDLAFNCVTHIYFNENII
jgi:hypothetical protein